MNVVRLGETSITLLRMSQLISPAFNLNPALSGFSFAQPPKRSLRKIANLDASTHTAETLNAGESNSPYLESI